MGKRRAKKKAKRSPTPDLEVELVPRKVRSAGADDLRDKLDEVRDWLERVMAETKGEPYGQSILIPGGSLEELKAILDGED
jgi:hypothetical protein